MLRRRWGKHRNRRGQGYAEYGFIIVLVGLGANIAVLSLGEEVEDYYLNQSSVISDVVEGGGVPEEP